MGVIESIREALREEASRCRIQDVRIGLVYTAVRMERGNTGLAYTFRERDFQCCPDGSGKTSLTGRNAGDILSFLGSGHRIESSLGLATANALIEHREEDMLAGDILDVISLGPEDRVGMVGFFQPIVETIRERAGSLEIFEQNVSRSPELLPEDKAYENLPSCSAAIITATAIVNRTLDGLLDAARDCREVVLLGASTPMFPEAFRGTPLTMLSGVVVTDPGEILRVVSEGGGMRQFKGLIRKVNQRIK